MKKNIFIIAAALTGLCLTACGPDSVNVNVTLSEQAVTTLTEEVVTETTVTLTETTAEAAVSTAAPAEDAAQTSAAQTTAAAAATCPYSADDLVGEWSMPGTFGTRNNSMTVRKDGSVIMRYAAGGTRRGKLRIDKEEHPDGSCSWWYSVYDDDNTAWIGFACDQLPVDRIASGHDGETEFVRVSLEDVAAEKMNNLTFLMRSMSGGGGDLETDSDRTLTDDGKTFALVTDGRFSISSLGKIAFERLLEETVSGSGYTQWKAVLDDSFRVSEPDGQTYVLVSGAHGFHTFETGHGVTISDLTDTWTIESYEFQ